MSRVALTVACVLLAGCPKSPPPAAEDASAPPAARADAAHADGGAEAPQEKLGAAGTFAGTYQAKPKTIYIPEGDEYKRVKPAPDEGTAMVGEGSMTLTVDDSGRVSGAIDSGPAAPAVLDGTLAGETLTARIRRKDPSDHGLTGVLAGKLTGDRFEGTMDLANATADVVREAKVSATKK